ncbi:MAG: TIGR03936 family radical SAM-associated protein [Bacillota bacterium]
MKVRVKYEKGDRVRFLGHLDVQRVVQIAASRAGWPLEMSQGYNPRPKFSFYSPLPAGTAGREECFDAVLSKPWSLKDLARSLSRALPEGFSLHEVREAPQREEPFESRIAASSYGLDLKGVNIRELSRALDAFMAEDVVPFVVVRPKEKKSVDLRPFVLHIGEPEAVSEERIVLNMTLGHDEGRTVRPQWVLGSLAQFGLNLDPREAIIDRRKILLGQREN